MSDSLLSNHPLILADFLSHLRDAKFEIGVDDYLRVQQLLNHPGFLCQPEELKTILCPLFAANEKQQQRFYESFDLFFANAFSPAKSEAVEPPWPTAIPLQQLPVEASPYRRFLYTFSTLAVVLGLSFAIWLWWPRTEPPPPEPPLTTLPSLPPSTTPQTTTTIQPIGAAVPANWQVISREPIPRSETREVEVPNAWRNNWHWLVLAISALPMLAMLALWLKRKLQQRWLRDKHRDKQPPFTWPLSVPKTTQRLHEIEPFNATTRLLRRRQQGEAKGLDIEATISATIARFGFPVLRFRPTSKVPEYLLLIDRLTLADHQAQFFNQLAAHFANEDVFVERYFFDGDPRICYSDDYLTGVPLTELPRNSQRLLVYGDGKGLLDNASGALAAWVEGLADWDDRALLTPTPPVQWGTRERKLSDLLVVSPATLEGLREVIAHYELNTQPDLRTTRRRSTEPELPNFDYDPTPAVTADKLRAYLASPALFQWACACALYPELQWDLTLCLGEQVMPDGQLWEKDILRLARLPWFRQGVIPDELRYELLRRLTPENQQKASVKLTEILKLTEAELLQQSPKFKNSWARESLGLQVDVQQWLAHRDDEHARVLRQRLREMPPELVTRDYGTLREVEAEPLTKLEQKLNDLLPAELHQSVYQNGIPLLGFKNGALAALAAPLALLIALSLALFKPPADGRTKTVPLNPEYERVTAVIPQVTPTPTITPPPGITPTPSATPTSDVAYGGIRITFDPFKDLSETEFGWKSYQGGPKQSHVLQRISVKEPFVWNDLRVGQYLLISPGMGVDVSSSCNNREVQVVSGKITDVRCQFIVDKPSSNETTCFAPVATISIPQTVIAGEEVSLNGTVNGGQNYGALTFDWQPSAGRLVSNGVNRASRPIYRLDTTGVAPGTTITLDLRVASSQGNCVATAQTRVTVTQPQASTTTSLLMPDLKGQDLATARRRLNALEPKLQITTQPVNDGYAKSDEVVRQDPVAGEPLKPGQQVTLYVAQALTNAGQMPARACYDITLNEVVTNQDGEVSSPKWSFDILADGKMIFALIAQTLSDQKTPVDRSVTRFGTRGTWCVVAEQPFRLGVIGTNVGEKDPQQRTASGEQVVKPPTSPYPINLPVRTPNPKDGDFTFRFTVRPANAATAK